MSQVKQSRSSPLLYGAIRALVWLLSLVPLGVARGAGGFAGWLLWTLPTDFGRVIRINLRLCLPELSPGERDRIGRASAIETGKASAESGAILRWSAARLARLVRRAQDADRLAREMDRGRGVLLVIPHLGNWEIFAAWLKENRPHDRPMALYRPPRLAELDNALIEARERNGVEMVAATPAGLKQAVRGLRDGRLMLVLPDQEPIESSGVFAPFFGTPALTMTLLGRLAGRYGAPVLCGWAQRVAGGFELVFAEASQFAPDGTPEEHAKRLNRDVERCVRTCPEQYVWSYKRFKTRPPGSAYLYPRSRSSRRKQKSRSAPRT